MSGRVYPIEVFERELDRLRIKYYYCPKCHSNNISSAHGYFTLIHEYKCLNCKSIFEKSESLTLSDIRNTKIDICLKNTKK